MPTKKKNKRSKLSRMSEEEHARYLQHRAELELETKRRKQQLIAIWSKNKLKHEETFSRLNSAKLNEQWRFILRQMKCKKLYEDVEYMHTNFERLVNLKNKIIKLLYAEIELAKDDHQRIEEAHIEKMDKMIGIHKQKLMFHYDNYICKMHNVQQHEVKKLDDLKQHLEEACNHIKRIISDQNVALQNTLTATMTQNATNIHNIIFLKKDLMSQITNQIYTNMENLWKELKKTMLEYEETTKSLKTQYKQLKQQDNADFAEMAQYPKISAQLQKTIETLTNDLKNLSDSRTATITELTHEANSLKKKVVQMRRNFTTDRTTEASQLKKLGVISNNVIKDLARISSKGTALLSIMKLCSSLEPLTISVKKYTSAALELEKQYSSHSISEPLNQLEIFWEQYNHVKVENICMKREYDKLFIENRQLRHKLRTYLINISRMESIPLITTVV